VFREGLSKMIFRPRLKRVKVERMKSRGYLEENVPAEGRSSLKALRQQEGKCGYCVHYSTSITFPIHASIDFSVCFHHYLGIVLTKIINNLKDKYNRLFFLDLSE
jgi:hypothetical protein